MVANPAAEPHASSMSGGAETPPTPPERFR